MTSKRTTWQEDLAAYQADLEDEEDEGIREILRSEIAHAERVLSIIEQALSVVD